MGTIIAILAFLTNQKVIIVGAATTIAELIVIIVNLVRKLRQVHDVTKKLFLGESPVCFDASVGKSPSARSLVFWAANPLNLLR